MTDAPVIMCRTQKKSSKNKRLNSRKQTIELLPSLPYNVQTQTISWSIFLETKKLHLLKIDSEIQKWVFSGSCRVTIRLLLPLEFALNFICKYNLNNSETSFWFTFNATLHKSEKVLCRNHTMLHSNLKQ